MATENNIYNSVSCLYDLLNLGTAGSWDSDGNVVLARPPASSKLDKIKFRSFSANIKNSLQGLQIPNITCRLNANIIPIKEAPTTEAEKPDFWAVINTIRPLWFNGKNTGEWSLNITNQASFTKYTANKSNLLNNQITLEEFTVPLNSTFEESIQTALTQAKYEFKKLLGIYDEDLVQSYENRLASSFNGNGGENVAPRYDVQLVQPSMANNYVIVGESNGFCYQSNNFVPPTPNSNGTVITCDKEDGVNIMSLHDGLMMNNVDYYNFGWLNMFTQFGVSYMPGQEKNLSRCDFFYNGLRVITDDEFDKNAYKCSPDKDFIPLCFDTSLYGVAFAVYMCWNNYDYNLLAESTENRLQFYNIKYIIEHLDEVTFECRQVGNCVYSNNTQSNCNIFWDDFDEKFKQILQWLILPNTSRDKDDYLLGVSFQLEDGTETAEEDNTITGFLSVFQFTPSTKYFSIDRIQITLNRLCEHTGGGGNSVEFDRNYLLNLYEGTDLNGEDFNGLTRWEGHVVNNFTFKNGGENVKYIGCPLDEEVINNPNFIINRLGSSDYETFLSAAQEIFYCCCFNNGNGVIFPQCFYNDGFVGNIFVPLGLNDYSGVLDSKACRDNGKPITSVYFKNNVNDNNYPIQVIMNNLTSDSENNSIYVSLYDGQNTTGNIAKGFTKTREWSTAYIDDIQDYFTKIIALDYEQIPDTIDLTLNLPSNNIGVNDDIVSFTDEGEDGYYLGMTRTGRCVNLKYDPSAIDYQFLLANAAVELVFTDGQNKLTLRPYLPNIVNTGQGGSSNTYSFNYVSHVDPNDITGRFYYVHKPNAPNDFLNSCFNWDEVNKTISFPVLALYGEDGTKSYYADIIFTLEFWTEPEVIDFDPDYVQGSLYAENYFNSKYQMHDKVGSLTTQSFSYENYIYIQDKQFYDTLSTFLLLNNTDMTLKLICDSYPTLNNIVFYLNETSMIDFKEATTSPTEPNIKCKIIDADGNILTPETARTIYSNITVCVDWQFFQ